MDILYFQGVRPFRFGGWEPSWTSFTSKGYDPLGWEGGTIMDILYFQVLHLPRKTSRRSSKCCACHAKRAGWAPNAAPATQTEAAPNVINRRRTSADLYVGAPSAAPATQNEPEELQVLRLPRKTSRMGPKCCACHADRSGAQCNQSSPDFRRPLCRCSKCCTCHAKRAGGAPSAAPATQKRAGWAPNAAPATQPNCNQSSPDFRGPLYEGAASACVQRKRTQSGSKCCTCHAKRAGWAPNATPATQTEAAPNVINRCPTSADPHEGAPSAVPATQNQPDVLKLPSYMELEDMKTMLSCEASLKK